MRMVMVGAGALLLGCHGASSLARPAVRPAGSAPASQDPEQVAKQFDAAWRDADVVLTRSAF